jgi:prophage regulatory protein
METNNRLIRISEVKHMVPFSRAKIYQLIKEEKFPKQLKEGGSSVWLLEDVLAYIKNLREGHNKNEH